MSSSPTTLTLIFLFFSLSFSFLLFAALYSRRKRRLASANYEEPRVPLNQTPPITSSSPSPPLSVPLASGDEIAMAEGEQKRRRKRGKKKKANHEGRGMSEGVDDATCLEIGDEPKQQQQQHSKVGESLYPFSSFASVTQRKIKLQYEQLVKSNQAKALTVDQVSQFINCLVDARNELQQKSEIIKRSFKIKKALLFKADRSSFDRLCQQIYKLEAEHKRLEEDAAVYNLLQEQLKLSPAYKTMLEIDANMGQKAELEDQATEFTDISFEELLAQEKKDGFWQRHGKLRMPSG